MNVRITNISLHFFMDAVHSLEVVSLDVTAGVVGAALFLVSLISKTQVHPAVFAALAAATLLVYNLDHLLDSYQPNAHSTPRRHRYAKHRQALLCAGLVSIVVGISTIHFLPISVIKYGAVVGLFQVMYFVGLKFGLKGPLKRILAALGWATGVAVPAWSLAAPALQIEIGVAAGLLACLAWINLQSYALVDDKTESDSGRKPGKILRVTALATTVIGLCWAYHAYPAKGGHWSALGSIAVIQALLKWAPDELVHPAGEWSIALLGAFSFLG